MLDETHEALLRQAMKLASEGYFIFPLMPRTKIPAFKKWQAGSTDDIRRVERRWVRARYNIGIDCGKSGLLVVDCDVKPGSDGRQNYLDQLKDHDPGHPDTLMVRTPSGGMHVYYRAAGELARNSVSKLAPNVDTRGVGGYVVARGSRLPNGAYSVHPSWDREVAQAPQALLDALAPRPVADRRPYALRHDLSRYAAGALRSELVAFSRSAAEGRRNAELSKTAARLGELCGAGVLDRHDTAELIQAAALRTGLGEDECRATIESGLSRGEQNPRLILVEAPGLAME